MADLSKIAAMMTWLATALKVVVFALCAIVCAGAAFVAMSATLGIGGLWIIGLFVEENVASLNAWFVQWVYAGALGFAVLCGLIAAGFVGWETLEPFLRSPFSTQQNIFERTRIGFLVALKTRESQKHPWDAPPPFA